MFKDERDFDTDLNARLMGFSKGSRDLLLKLTGAAELPDSWTRLRRLAAIRKGFDAMKAGHVVLLPEPPLGSPEFEAAKESASECTRRALAIGLLSDGIAGAPMQLQESLRHVGYGDLVAVRGHDITARFRSLCDDIDDRDFRIGKLCPDAGLAGAKDLRLYAARARAGCTGSREALEEMLSDMLEIYVAAYTFRSAIAAIHEIREARVWPVDLPTLD